MALLRNFPITSQFWVPVATVKSVPPRPSGAAHEKRTLPQLWAVPSSRRTRLGPPLLHYVGPVVTVVALPQLPFPTFSDEHQRLELTNTSFDSQTSVRRYLGSSLQLFALASCNNSLRG